MAKENTMAKEHPHHKMASKHSKDGHVVHMGADHWEKKPGETEVADGKYASSEMGNPEELKRSVDALASYTKKHKMKY